MNNEKALFDVRAKVKEVLDNEHSKRVFGWRAEAEPTRAEGEEWEALDGRKWVMKNGIKQTVTKLDAAKTPWWCPKCNKPLNHRHDLKAWRIRGYCMDCLIVEETEMRRLGTWAEYERNVMLRNYIAILKDKIAELQDYHDTVSNPEFIDADDTKILLVDRWSGVDIDQVKKDIRADIEKLKAHLEETIAEHGTGEVDV